MVVIPTLLVTKTVRAVNCFWVAVVVTKGSKYWTTNVLLE